MDDFTLWDRLADAQWHTREATLKDNELMAGAWRRQERLIERLIERQGQ